METLDGRSFELEVIQCVEHALSNFGENVPNTVLNNLRWIGGISKEEIPIKPDEFERGLDIVFRQASHRVKHAVLQEIESRFALCDCYPSLREVIAVASSRFQ